MPCIPSWVNRITELTPTIFISPLLHRSLDWTWHPTISCKSRQWAGSLLIVHVWGYVKGREDLFDRAMYSDTWPILFSPQWQRFGLPLYLRRSLALFVVRTSCLRFVRSFPNNFSPLFLNPDFRNHTSFFLSSCSSVAGAGSWGRSLNLSLWTGPEYPCIPYFSLKTAPYAFTCTVKVYYGVLDSSATVACVISYAVCI